MPWGRGGPWAGAGAWVDGQGRVAMARTTGRCGRPARLVAAICSACGQRLGESSGPWVAEGPICPLGGGRVWPGSQKRPKLWRPGARPVPSSFLNLKALRSGDRTRPEETLMVLF